MIHPHHTSALQDLTRKYPAPKARYAAWGMMIILGVFAGWACTARLDEVAIADGDVIPEGKTKVVQHLEGGIITQMMVAEGDTVTQGSPILQLELSTTALNKEEAQIRLDGLLLQKARLQAEAEGTDLAFPPEESKRQPALVEAERATFIARKNENTAKIAVLNAQIQQKQQIYKELRAKKRSLERNLNIIGQKVSMSAKLLAEKLTPQMDHLQLTSEYEDTKGQISSITEAIPGAYSALQEIKGRLEEEKTRVQREARTELSSVELAIARIRQTLSRAEDQQNRTTIRSPITGIIKNMRYNTIGGVVQPGEPIMDIVPLQDKLVVQARLNPIDRGYVAPGQKAVVKVLTYDYARYGGLEGTVVHVAPDSTIPDNAPPYFRVVVETNKTWLGSKKGEYPITPGMQTTVDIHTGSKTVIDYLITPILKLKHESFRER